VSCELVKMLKIMCEIVEMLDGGIRDDRVVGQCC
jgi:hypothetical protein